MTASARERMRESMQRLTYVYPCGCGERHVLCLCPLTHIVTSMCVHMHSVCICVHMYKHQLQHIRCVLTQAFIQQVRSWNKTSATTRFHTLKNQYTVFLTLEDFKMAHFFEIF